MKKYPFSNRAVQAIVAATIALSPIASTGIVNPVQVEAATNYTQLDSYLNELNANLRDYEISWLKSQVQSSEYDEAVQELLTDKLSPSLADDQAEAASEVIKALFEVYYKNSTGDFTSIEQGLSSKDVKAVLDSELPKLESVFSNTGLSASNFPQAFFKFLEVYHVELSKKFSVANILTNGFDQFLNPSVLAKNVLDNVSGTPEALELKKYLNSLGLEVADLISVKDSYSSYMTEEEKAEAEKILASAAVRAKGLNIQLGDVVLDSYENSFQLENGQSTDLGVTMFAELINLPGFSWNTNGHYTISEDGILTATKATDDNGTTIELKYNDVVVIKEKLMISEKNTGGGTTTPSPEQNVEVPEGFTETSKADGVVTTKIPADKVQDIVALVTDDKSVIPVKLAKAAAGEKVNALLPGSLFSEVLKKNAKAVIEIQTDDAVYKLPASQINVAALAKKLGVSASDVQIIVSVNVVDATKTINKNSLKSVSKVVEFTVDAVAGDKKESISTFSVYVERDMIGENNFYAKNSVGVVLQEDGSFKAVPTLFNGKKATIKSLTNSKYTIVENDKTFPDVNNKVNWAEEYIETLASKYIINGKDNGTYAPLEQMTRAQFTVLLVRALGLPAEGYDNSFSDVKGDEWFNANGELMAAVNYGIIKGKDDGRFAPYDKVTRTQAASMIARAMKLDFLNYDQSNFDTTKKVTDFKDAGKIGSYAKEDIEAVYQAGIIKGKDNGTFDPYGFTKRDQMAKMLAEFLISADLMNDTIN